MYSKFLALFLSLLVTGCLVSENSFYLEQQICQDSRLEGAFSNSFGGKPENKTKWFIQPYQPDGPENWKQYKITVVEGDVKNEMLGTLFKIDGQSFLDLFPLTDSGVGKEPGSVVPSEYMRTALYKPRHTIWKVKIEDDGIAYSFPLGNGVFAAVRSTPELTNSVEENTKMIVMTQTTEEMQRIVTKLSKESEVFTGEGVLVRVKE